MTQNFRDQYKVTWVCRGKTTSKLFNYLNVAQEFAEMARKHKGTASVRMELRPVGKWELMGYYKVKPC